MKAGTITPQLAALQNERGLAKRRALAAWRKALKDGEVKLADVFREQPECMRHLPLLDIIRLGSHWGPGRAAALNGYAVRCHVNLAVPLGDAADVTVDWVARAVEAKPDRGWAALNTDTSPSEFKALREQCERHQHWAEALDQAVAAHQRLVQGPVEDDADIASADTELWRVRENLRQGRERRDLRFARLWNAGVSTREIAKSTKVTHVGAHAANLRRRGFALVQRESGRPRGEQAA